MVLVGVLAEDIQRGVELEILVVGWVQDEFIQLDDLFKELLVINLEFYEKLQLPNYEGL